ncbi:MAG: glycoside hydrolase family 15 protein [Mycobacterium kyogaense]|uniref:glycoside hydrolase family 15 protein n=1 Tax=Mycobacterium kyogaense TaxID=2212479 RepID=UPI002FF5EF33
MSAPELDPVTSALEDTANRTDGYVALRDYAPIGDGRTVALVALDGAIDWLPLPRLDALPVFGALLDPANGGRLELCPDVPFTATRRYLGATNVLQTTFVTETGTVRVTDSMNVGVAGRLPWTELGRRIDGVQGSVPMRWRVAPGTCFDTASPWTRETPHGTVLRSATLSMSVCTSPGLDVTLTDQAALGTFTAHAGQRYVVGLLSADDEPLMLSSADEVDRGIDRAIEAWSTWAAQIPRYEHFDADLRRSALLLKLLIDSGTGSIAAAATASLPERPAGGKNWDYRFAWVRDTAYTVDALQRLGLREETHASVSWLLRTIRRHGCEAGVFFTLDGSQPAPPVTHDVPGWRGVGPVVTGNPAAGQLQLSIFADLFNTVRLYVDGGHALDTHTGHLLATFADAACDAWRRTDSGMWELEEVRHYTSSKLGCWQALRCAVHLAELGQIPGDQQRWAAEADRIADWIRHRCWSPEVGAYVWFPGTDKLDASVLLHAGSGFDRSERMSATIDAIRDRLGAGPLIYRYSGAREEGEGAFVACSFWVVSALRAVGRDGEARGLLAELLEYGNDVGMFAEMIDPADRGFLGNLPQGLSHLALIGAALDVRHP